MTRKNKNVVLITVLLVLISLSIVLFNDIVSINRNDSSVTINDKYNDLNDNADDYFNNNFFGQNNYETVTTKDSNSVRLRQIVFTVLLVAMIVVANQIFFYILFSGFNYLSFRLTFRPLAKIGVYLLLSLGLTGMITYFALSTIEIIPYEEIKNIDSNDSNKNNTDVSLNGKEIDDYDINLNDYKENIMLYKSGTYEISGNFDKTIVTKSSGDITLKLNEVTITTKDLPNIVNIGTGKLKIDLKDNTKNTLITEETSNYDGSIYSIGPLEVKGTGTLEITSVNGIGINVASNDLTISNGNLDIKAKTYGIVTSDDGGLIDITSGNIVVESSKANIKSKQNLTINGGMVYLYGTLDDSPIDTENGYQINGGSVVALGQDIYESPLVNSKKYTVCLKLSEKIEKDKLISLVDSNGKAVISFKSKEEFDTIIMSSEKLSSGSYTLYKEGALESGDDADIVLDKKYSKGEIIDKNIVIESKVTTKR